MTYSVHASYGRVGGAAHCMGTRADGKPCGNHTSYVVDQALPWYCHLHGKTLDDRGRKIPPAMRTEPRAT